MCKNPFCYNIVEPSRTNAVFFLLQDFFINSDKYLAVFFVTLFIWKKNRKKTAKHIANVFDVTIIYDKIDGKHIKEYNDPIRKITRIPGETSQITYDEMTKHLSSHNQLHQEIEEEKAIKLAQSLAEKGDVIIHIPTENHAQSMKYVRKHLT